MTVDVIAIIIFGVLVYLGWRSGALAQVLRVVAAVLVVLFGRDAAAVVRDIVAGTDVVAEPVVEVGCYFAGGFLLYLTIVLSGWFVIRTMRAAAPTLATMDRAAGASIGAVKAALIVYVLVMGAVLIGAALESEDPDDHMHLRDGYATKYAAKLDALSPWRHEEVAAFVKLVRTAASTTSDEARQLVENNPEIAELLDAEPMRTLMSDDKLREAAEAGEYARVLADERVRKLLNDREFRRRMRDIDFAKLKGEVESRK